MMKWLQNLFGKKSGQADVVRPKPPREPEPEEIVVPEVTVEALRAEMVGEEADTTPHEATLYLLDVREPFEWRQVRIPTAQTLQVLHIPMSELPDRVHELERDRPWVVMCAHGSRSYSVAAWLMEQDYTARSLRGGITAWSRSGGTIEQG
jgi:rhodanese-related sulfurtransferase